MAENPIGEAVKSSEEADLSEVKQFCAAELGISRKYYPKIRQQDIDAQLEATYAHAAVAEVSEPEDAKELVEWAKAKFDLDFDPKLLTGVTRAQAQQVLWNEFDRRYRPEMR